MAYIAFPHAISPFAGNMTGETAHPALEGPPADVRRSWLAKRMVLVEGNEWGAANCHAGDRVATPVADFPRPL